MTRVLLFLLTALSLNAAPAFVGVLTKNQTGSQVTSFQLQFTPTAGNMVTIHLACSTDAIGFTITSPQGTWQQDCYQGGGGVQDTTALWSLGGASGVQHTVTIGVSASEFVRYSVLQWSGVATNSRVIATNSNTGTSQTITTGNVTTATNDTLLVAFLRTDGDETAHGTIGAGSNFTLTYAYSGNEPDQKLMSEYRVVAAGTYGNGFTLQAQDGGGWVAGIVAYKSGAADGGGGFTPTAPFAPKRLRLIRSR